MAIDKIFNDANVDGIADNIFGAVNNSVSEVKAMQQRKAAENVQMVVEAFKKIETNITEKFDNVTDVIEKRVLTIKDGRDGSSGSDGRNGRDGKPGRDGINGKQGTPGTPGKDGIDGVDGVSVTDANIDFDGSLVISLSSGQQINVGEIVPPELERQLVELRQGGSSGSGGDVAGPTSSTDNAIVRFDGTTGKVVQNSVVTIADTTGDIAGVGTLTASGNTSLATTPVLYSGDGTVSSGRLLGRYSYRTATPTTAYFYDFNNSNTIASSDALFASKLATLIDSTITNANALTAFGTSYGTKAAGVSFVSGTSSDVLLAAISSPPLLNADINAVIVGYTSNGPRIAIQNYALNDDTANAISYVGAVHRFYPAGTEVAKISSTGLAITGAATISTTLGVTGATTLSAALTYGGVTLTNAVTGTGKMVLDTSPTLVTPALGSPSSVGTMPAFTLGGTVSGGGNQINNVVIGTTTPLAGAFTTLSASSTLSVTGAGSIEGLTVGRGAGASTTNTVVGANALSANTIGINNDAFGNAALKSNTTGAGNVALGLQTLFTNTTGARNLASGTAALYYNTTGDYNVGLGYTALYKNTTASNNTAVGYQAGYSHTTGGNNTALGAYALQTNTTASNNTAVGYQALYTNTGGDCTAVGYKALFSNTTGTNVAVGESCLQSNTTGTTNVAIAPYSALYYNTSGSQNNAVGHQALQNNTTASYNNAFGYRALWSNTTGANNSAFGESALFSNTGGNNTALGASALQANTTASNSIAVGYQAGYSNQTGENLLAIGALAGYSSTATDNIFIGYQAGYYVTATTTGQQNIILGHYSRNSAAGVNTEIIIGYGLVGKGATTAFVGGIGGAYNAANTATWSTTSDQRLKKNIVDNNTGLDIINQIQVRNFEYRLPEEVTDVAQDQAIKKQGVQLGVIAQELQQILPECVKTESTGVLTVDADNLTWYLVNAVKELSAQVAQLQSQLKGN